MSEIFWRHIINYTIAYYVEDKRKKYVNDNIVVKFKNYINNTNQNFNYELQYFYNVDENNNENNTNIYKKLKLEKARVTKAIKKLIPSI